MKLYKSLGLAVLLLGLTGCNENATAENFAKIESRMPRDEVIKILGEPDACAVKAAHEACRWGNKRKGIDIQFMAGRVGSKTAHGL